MSRPSLLIVKTGSTLPVLRRVWGDFEIWIARRLPGAQVRICNPARGERLPPPERHTGVIVTGSPAMVSHRAPWSERTGEWLAEAVAQQRPVLGICYGHQLIAHGLGGRVGPNPRGREIGTVSAALTEAARDDPLLRAGTETSLAVQTTHLETVLELPDGARTLACTELDRYQAVRYGALAWGVQFHPEFSALVMAGYILGRRAALRRERRSTLALLRSLRRTPRAEALLPRFAALAADSR